MRATPKQLTLLHSVDATNTNIYLILKYSVSEGWLFDNCKHCNLWLKTKVKLHNHTCVKLKSNNIDP